VLPPCAGTSCELVLDVGVRPLHLAEVAAFPCRVDRAHEVQVRRRAHGAIGSSSSSDTPRSLSASSLWAYDAMLTIRPSRHLVTRVIGMATSTPLYRPR